MSVIISVMNERKVRQFRLSGSQSILLGFLAMILAGTLLLMLPISTRTGEWTSFTNAFFTATSASCVTGLVLYDTASHWSIFGQVVILTMIQIGGRYGRRYHDNHLIKAHRQEDQPSGKDYTSGSGLRS